MKRLLAQIGITYFSALAVAFYLPEKGVIALLALAAAATGLLILIRYTRRLIFPPLIALTVVIGCAVNLGYTYLTVIPVQESFAGNERRIEATLTDEAYKAYSKFYYRLEADTIDGKPADVKLLLKTAKPIAITPYDRISFTADISATENNYYLSKGYFLTVNTYDNDFTVTAGGSRPLYAEAIRVRETLRDALDEYLPEDTAALCKAVLVGDKYALDEDTKTDFRYAGASFFVVVSGLHFSIICLLFYRLLTKLRVNRFVTVGLTLLLIVFYMFVTGFQPSVVRTGVMMIVLVFSRLFRRIGYAPNSLGLAGIVSAIAFTPYGVGDIGLILSFAATFAILMWSDPIHQLLCKPLFNKMHQGRVRLILNRILRLLSTSLAANILVFPISVMAFRGFSLVTLVSSLLLYVPIWLILVLSLGLCLLFCTGFLRFPALLLSWPLHLISRFTLWLVDALASLPFSYVNIGSDYVYIWLGISILLGVIVIALRNRCRCLPYAVILSGLILLGGMISSRVTQLNTVALQVYDCGEGLTVGFDYHGNLTLFAFDAKSREAYRIAENLSRRYGSAQLAVCSKKHDFVNYTRLTDREFAVSHFLLYDNSIHDTASDELIAYSPTEDYHLGGGALLHAEEKDGRLLSILTVDGTTVVVIPPRYPYSAIPDRYRSADIIVMSRAEKDYDKLSCGTLIVSGTADEAQQIAALMSGRYTEIRYTCQGDVTVPLR